MIAENIEIQSVATGEANLLIVAPRFFDFENDFVGTLKCIPMIVRYKLDICRIKLKLSDWGKLNFEEKDKLAQMACYECFEIEKYTDFVNEVVWKYTGSYPSILAELNDSWNYLGEVPAEVNQKAREWECPEITLKQWANLDLLERFALVKLSRSGHEGKNFPAAVREFLVAI